MLNQLKKTGFSSLRKLMVLPIVAASVLLFSFKVSNNKIVRADKTITLALDAGHGGEDNGALGLNGIKEKDIALKITHRLSQLGEDYNVKVITIRHGDEYIALEDRVAQINNLSADMLVSIHLNKHGKDNVTAKGVDIVVAKRSSNYTESRVLGSSIAAQFKTTQIQSQLVDKGAQVLRTVDVPALIIECGYVDNAADIARINNDAQLDKLCNAILIGLVAYQNNRSK